MEQLLNIVIPSYNSFDFLENCLASIPEAADGIDYFVTIVENGSDPDKVKGFYEKIEGDNVYVQKHKQALGFPLACNMGAKRKACPLILFLNADVTLEPGSIKEMVKTMDDPEVGIVGMKLLFPEDTPHGPYDTIQHVGLALDIKAKPYHIFIGWNKDNPKPNAMDDVWTVTGAALMVRRSLFNKAGGFDEKYGKGTFEDLDLCLTIRKLGYKIKVNTDAVGYHYVGHTESQYPMNRNYQLFMQKWGQELKWNEWKYL